MWKGDAPRIVNIFVLPELDPPGPSARAIVGAARGVVGAGREVFLRTHEGGLGAVDPRMEKDVKSTEFRLGSTE